MTKKYHFFIYTVFILIFGAFLITLSLTPYQNWGGDFSSYIMQARSIVDGAIQKFIEKNTFTIQQSIVEMGPIAYPWGYPIMLAVSMALGCTSLWSFKIISTIFFTFTAALLVYNYRNILRPLWSSVLLSLFMFNYVWSLHLNSIFPDIAFLFFSTASILWMTRFIIRRKYFISPVGDSLFLGICIFIANTIRANGIVLLAALLLTQCLAVLFRLPHKPKKYEIGISIIPYGIYLACTFIWGLFLPKGGSYTPFEGIFELHTILNQLPYYSSLLANLVPLHGGPISTMTHIGDIIPFVNASTAYVIYGCTIIPVLSGMYSRWKEDYPALIYCALTVGMLIVFPYRQGIRYIFPVVPFYLFFLCAGIQNMISAKPQWLRRSVQAGATLVVLLMLGQSSYWAWINYQEHGARPVQGQMGPYAVRSQELFQYIREHTPPDSTVSFFKPRVLRMLTGRNSFVELTATPRGDYLALCLWNDNGYYQLKLQHINNLIQAGKLQLVFKNDDFALLKTL